MDILESLGLKPAEKKPVEQKVEPSAEVVELKKQLEKLQRDNLLRTSATKTVVAPVAPKLDLKGLPDPLSEPEAFYTALSERLERNIETRMTNAREGETARASKASRWDALWAEFQEAHPTHSKDRDRVEFAVGNVLKRAQRKGIDPETLALEHTDMLFTDVVAEMDKQFGRAAEGEEEEEEGEEEETPRTTLLRSKPKVKKPAAEKEEEPDMVKELRTLQMASGFF